MVACSLRSNLWAWNCGLELGRFGRADCLSPLSHTVAHLELSRQSICPFHACNMRKPVTSEGQALKMEPDTN